MAKLTKQQLKEFKQRLLEERAKFAGEIRSIAREASKNPREASGDLSAYTIHMADMSADTYERELSMDLASSEQEVLYQIDEALKRFEEETYGTCQQCSKPIALTRLKAVPYTSLCIGCQRAKEQKATRKS
ncbi:MAG: TraR/DksA C4-type zinc finger protein [Candidatus Omnitrophica bacterium]|nr:TraR/DksA C4-type zinc finger protein [Candidatus Omnitrophota bacterium]